MTVVRLNYLTGSATDTWDKGSKEFNIIINVNMSQPNHRLVVRIRYVIVL